MTLYRHHLKGIFLTIFCQSKKDSTHQKNLLVCADLPCQFGLELACLCRSAMWVWSETCLSVKIDHASLARNLPVCADLSCQFGAKLACLCIYTMSVWRETCLSLQIYHVSLTQNFLSVQIYHVSLAWNLPVCADLPCQFGAILACLCRSTMSVWRETCLSVQIYHASLSWNLLVCAGLPCQFGARNQPCHDCAVKNRFDHAVVRCYFCTVQDLL